MPIGSNPPLFILGVERSGSTWLANIFDAHPETVLMMEPFTPRIVAFPDFPDRLIHLDGANSFLRDHVHEGFGRLIDEKYGYGGRPGSSRLRRGLTYRGLYPAGEFVTRGMQALGFQRPLRHLRFKNLNKNRLENPYLNELEKAEEPKLLACKELRLNFKAGLIEDCWPEARVLVIVRNPLSQIASILRLLKEGALHELRSALYAILEHARSSARLERYRSALSRLDGDDLRHRALAYWFSSYGTLLDDLEDSGLTHRIVRHEDLSERPSETARELIEFAGLPGHRQVDEYVAFSTGVTSGERVAEDRSVMDTRRDSRSYVTEALLRAPDTLRRELSVHGDPLWEAAPAALRAYRGWLDDRLD